jgi:hypothetical protein
MAGICGTTEAVPCYKKEIAEFVLSQVSKIRRPGAPLAVRWTITHERRPVSGNPKGGSTEVSFLFRAGFPTADP